MRQFRRGDLARLCLALVLFMPFIHQAAADATKPRALVAVFESVRISLPQGPLPQGLRFVLYDDGEVITRSDPTQADPDPSARGVTFGRLAPDVAEELRRNALADLQEAAAVDSGDSSLADVGITTLEVWDGGQYLRFSAKAMPCQAQGRALPEAIWHRMRERTDAHFLKVCDRLLQFRIPAPQPWKPRAVQLVLGALEEPAEHRVDWPKEWPAPPPGLKPKAGTFFCAPVNAEPSDFSSTLVNAKWGDIGRTALVIDANTSAVIWDWYFDLPAEIPTMNEKGEPAPPIGNSCAHVARP